MMVVLIENNEEFEHVAGRSLDIGPFDELVRKYGKLCLRGEGHHYSLHERKYICEGDEVMCYAEWLRRKQ